MKSPAVVFYVRKTESPPLEIMKKQLSLFLFDSSRGSIPIKFEAFEVVPSET